MKRERTGRKVTVSTVGGEHCQAFVPDPLPPNPPLKMDSGLEERLQNASIALGRLDSISTLLPDPERFLYMYVRKEAVLSSQIEGTQASISDFIKHEIRGTPGGLIDDVREVSNYVAAMNHGLERIKSGLPLSLRLLREMHEILLHDSRGGEKMPGEFRKSQNWIGGSRPGTAKFVPPPPESVPECMGDLEKFLHDDPIKTSLLIKAGLSHVQFETIHPFLDGNGRIGRLLITVLLCSEGALKEPTLYLSLYFKSHRQDYYALLQAVREFGEWEEWMSFFLDGVEKTSNQAVVTAKSLVEMFEADHNRIIENSKQSAGSVVLAHRAMQQQPIITIPRVVEMTSVSYPTAKKAVKTLERLGIVHQLPKDSRAAQYSYTKYLKMLDEGTEPL